MSQSLPIVGHIIDGKKVLESKRSQEVFNPAKGVAEKKVLLADKSQVEAAITSAERSRWRASFSSISTHSG